MFLHIFVSAQCEEVDAMERPSKLPTPTSPLTVTMPNLDLNDAIDPKASSPLSVPRDVFTDPETPVEFTLSFPEDPSTDEAPEITKVKL
jgi:hypothetical protein